MEVEHDLDLVAAAGRVIGVAHRQRLRHRVVALADRDRARVRVVERVALQVRVVAVDVVAAVVLVERGARRARERVDVLAPRAAGRRRVEPVDVHPRDDRERSARRGSPSRPLALLVSARMISSAELDTVNSSPCWLAMITMPAVAPADRDDRDPAAGALGGVGAPAEARGAVGALHVLAHRLDELVVVADRRQRLVLVRLRPRPARRGLRRGRPYQRRRTWRARRRSPRLHGDCFIWHPSRGWITPYRPSLYPQLR